MRRVNHLHPCIVHWDNLRWALWAALKGCRNTRGARMFLEQSEQELREISTQLSSGVLDVGHFNRFTIFDPKKRTISAPVFRERVMHHAIMRVCGPVLDRRLDVDTYACRKGKGQGAAIKKAMQCSKNKRYFLKMDIRSYFDTIDQENAKWMIRRVFKEKEIVGYFEQILNTYHTEPGKGVPIGSLISQHLANYYLSPLDRLVKSQLKNRDYVRYMDDFVIWDDSLAILKDAKNRIEELLYHQLGLRLKPYPYINTTAHGMDFLGCRVFAGKVKLAKRSIQRFYRKSGKVINDWEHGELSELELQQRLNALVSFISGKCNPSFMRPLMCHEF